MKKLKTLKTVLCIAVANSEYSSINQHLKIEFGKGVSVQINGLDDFAVEFLDPVTSVKWVLVGLTFQGQTETAVASSKLHRALAPTLTFMVGMCMGVPSKNYAPGTVVIPNEVFNFDHTRITKQGYQFRPHGSRMTTAMYKLAKLVSVTEDLGYKVVIDKGLASASSKIEHASSGLAKFIEQSFPDVVAYDMEGTGFYAALAEKQCLWIKAVADSGETQLQNHEAQDAKRSTQKTATLNAIDFAIKITRTYVEINKDSLPTSSPTGNQKNAISNKSKKPEPPFSYRWNEEVVTFEEKLRSLTMDVIKVNAHTHFLGVAAEYAWIDHCYAGCNKLMQSITSLEHLQGKDYDSVQTHFDVVKIKLADGREKEVYFDISSFFGGGSSSLINHDDFVGKKLSELYGI